MATDILKLKKQAVAAGMDRNTARTASRATLEAFLEKPKAPAKKVAASGVKKRTTTRTASTRTTTRKPAAKKTAPARTRPAAKKPVPAKAPATRSTAKRPATKTKAPVRNGDSGRNALGTLDFTNTDGWNPREGSAVDVIFRTLKRYKGNVEKTFQALLPDIGDFVGLRKRDNTKRTKTEREAMLRYRISRTKFDFAIKTGQHEIATERVEYGTGAYASTRAKKSAPARTARPKPKAKVAANGTRRTAARPAAKPNTTRRTTARKTARKR